MVKLDVRQESSRHADVLDTITKYLGLGSYKCAPAEACNPRCCLPDHLCISLTGCSHCVQHGPIFCNRHV